MPDHEQRSPYPRRTVLRALTIGAVGAGMATTCATQTAVAHTGLRDLRAGMSGADVRELQIRVAGWASDSSRQAFLNVSGYFDAPTEAAVRRFQQAHGLPVGGVVDQATHGRLSVYRSKSHRCTSSGVTVLLEQAPEGPWCGAACEP
jgi:zinc D-Ala-D-Ala carboxypeptidase